MATTWLSRIRGLLGRSGRDLAPDEVLCLVPCGDIHTFGMAFSLDVAFVSSDGRVIFVCRDLGPGGRKKVSGSVAVLERKASDESWFEAGDQVGVFPVQM